jgi:hypothetical protein
VQKVVRIGKRIVLSIFAILALLALGAGWVWLSTEQEEVAFQSGDITIRGTLLSPRFGREAPGVVLVHGSGQTSRNSTMLYAWIFASLGYAALAYDKRGVGQSEGGSNEWDEFSVGDLASDAAAGYRYLQSLIEVDPERVRILDKEGLPIANAVLSRPGGISITDEQGFFQIEISQDDDSFELRKGTDSCIVSFTQTSTEGQVIPLGDLRCESMF